MDAQTHDSLITKWPRKECKHCSNVRTFHARGLCKTCYDDKGIRLQYPTSNLSRAAGTSAGKCAKCECYLASAMFATCSAVCPTCLIPNPLLRHVVHNRLTEYEKRYAAKLPLFDGLPTIEAEMDAELFAIHVTQGLAS